MNKKLLFFMVMVGGLFGGIAVFAQTPTNTVTPNVTINPSNAFLKPCDDKNASTCYNFIEPLPQSDGTLLENVDTSITGEQGKGLGGFITFVIQMGTAVAGVIGVVMLTVYGFQYAANDQNIANFEVLRGKITGVVLGLLLLLGIFIILNTINPDLLIVEPGIPIAKLSLDDQLAISAAGYDISTIKNINPVKLSEAKAVAVQRSKVIETVYIPARDRVLTSASIGVKTLITSQAQFEGFFPGSLSYRTNNPGNINNTDNGSSHSYTTLEQGIKAQYDHMTRVALNQEKNYKLGDRKVSGPAYGYPGIDFIYKGYLEQYLKIYALGPRKDNSYLNFIMGYFKKNNLVATPQTTISEIYYMQ